MQKRRGRWFLLLSNSRTLILYIFTNVLTFFPSKLELFTPTGYLFIKAVTMNRNQYIKQYYQDHKEEWKERNHLNYLKRKARGIKQDEQIDIYQTREELRDAEEREEGKINWNIWDKVQEETKNDITKALEDYEEPTNRQPIYVYTMTSKMPLFQFKNSDEAEKTLGINRMIITNHARTQRPLYNRGILFSYLPIN